MASVPKILLVLFEGLPGTVIESQVLLHAREMSRLGIASFEIWAFACSEALYRSSHAMQAHAEGLAGCRVRVLRGVRPVVPFSAHINARLLRRALRHARPEFDMIHARTDYTARICGILRRAGAFTLLWDCRGDAVAELLDRTAGDSPFTRLAGAIRARLLRRDRALAARLCDRGVFVTRVLKALAQPEFGVKPAWVIPGTAPSDLFHFDLGLRERIRAQLGFMPHETVYVFSGSLAPYQCFDEMLEMFSVISAQDPQARLLLLTPAVKAAEARLAKLGLDAMVRHAGISDVNGYLNAADIAFMLRSHSATNRAAFPTKFSEYCLAGLPVIMTDAVPDAYRVAAELGNHVAPPHAGQISLPASYNRQEVARRACQSLTRESVAPLYAEAYRG
ncbi:MAG: glycosyltransferase [Ferrovibrio sp.]